MYTNAASGGVGYGPSCAREILAGVCAAVVCLVTKLGLEDVLVEGGVLL